MAAERPNLSEFETYLARWRLAPDGAPFSSYTRSRLLFVRLEGGVPAVLKLPGSAEERAGGALMAWWAGEGAARVHGWDEASGALLLERAEGRTTLLGMLAEGRHDDATRVLAAAAMKLHAARADQPPASLVPLERWFRDLWPAAERLGGVFRSSAAAARELLDAPQGVAVLHGDLHHENVLDFGAKRGWLAIDPKGLLGERGFDLVHHLFDRDEPTPPPAELVERQVRVAAEAAGLDPARQRRWALAWAGLSAVWCMEDGLAPGGALGVAELLAAD